MARNTYVPAGLTNTRAYNWTRSAYQARNVPTDSSNGNPGARWQSVSAYEWMNYGDVTTGINQQTYATSNPPFREWEAGRLPGDFLAAVSAGGSGVPARILRGYIRRAEYNSSDRASLARLYFMYNPERIERQYVSYLDQGALDPFNSVYQSGNLVAPPSFMDFTFELFFDRQSEATHPDNPGVLVDQEYFDMVVRNVIPGSEFTNGSIPDNGVMMVNPRDISVIFSPTMSIQGRPLNSSMVFEKFTHRMTPTRMRIALTMRVIYIGPPRDLTAFTQQETINIERRVPFDIKPPEPFKFTYETLSWENNGEDLPVTTPENMPGGSIGATASSNGNAGLQAMNNAAGHAGISDSNQKSSTMRYDSGARSNPWTSVDCSGFVWAGFMVKEPNDVSQYGAQFGWAAFEKKSAPDSRSMKQAMGSAADNKVLKIFGFGQAHGELDDSKVMAAIKTMAPGDILYRVDNPNHTTSPGTSGNHIAFLWRVESDRFFVCHASSPSAGVCIAVNSNNHTMYNYGCRVLTAAGASGATTSSGGGGGGGTPISGVKITVYSPQTGGDPIEGGLDSSRPGLDGKSKVRTLDDVRAGTASYVTLAGDNSWYYKKYNIPTITYDSYASGSKVTATITNVIGYVHDTGSYFNGKPEGVYDLAVGKDYSNAQMNSQPFAGSGNIQLRPL